MICARRLAQAATRNAATRIGQQIQKGRALRSLAIRSESDLDAAHAEKSKWADYTEELLGRLFTNRSLAQEYRNAGFGVVYMNATVGMRITRFYETVQGQITPLDSILQRLELFPEPTLVAPAPRPQANRGHSRTIFVVHGHDEGTRESVCRFLERLELHSLVLHEQASKGMTIIVKIEAHSEVEFAIVLMTADDVGAPRGSAGDLKPRSRQNVVLELGYFLAKVGRSRVCALYQAGVELPSDFAGVAYVPLEGHWQFALAKEIRAVGIEVDLNRL